jgi:hypothetical protein
MTSERRKTLDRRSFLDRSSKAAALVVAGVPVSSPRRARATNAARFDGPIRIAVMGLNDRGRVLLI